ncbi:MAG: hypothetical protein HUJ25_02745 [Crocinitomicaceae bacterium]|nr:hypothetical protein [Crocinitomicaceae bacterium]
MKKTLILIAATTLVLTACKKKGCMDPLATNYSTEAEKDDGSCVYDGNVVNGEITEDITTNTIIGSGVTKVCGTIDVTAELQISAGAIIEMCSGASFNVQSSGSISAIGTASEPIIIKGETASAGFWNGIAIRSNNPLNKLDYVTVKDAGAYWGYEYANVFVDGSAKLDIQNSTIDNSDQIGLFVSVASTLTGFSNNTFSNSQTGLMIGPDNIDMLDINSDYLTGNSNNFIHVMAGTISTNTSWSKLSAPILLHGLDIDAGLTLSPGLEIWVEANDLFNVNSTGYLSAIGTASENIIIKGRYASAGYWGGIKVASNNPNNVFNYVSISDGGSYWGNDYSNIQITGSLEIDNCSVSNGNSWGMYVNTSTTITSGGGVTTSAATVESNNTFSSNGNGADASCTGGCGVFFE